jgi:hypothetical protein
MKAERLKKSEEFIDTYLGGNRNVSTLTWDHWVECLQDYADNYARIQIEKDREETKLLMNEKLKDFEGLNPEIEEIIDRPIKLD